MIESKLNEFSIGFHAISSRLTAIEKQLNAPLVASKTNPITKEDVSDHIQYSTVVKRQHREDPQRQLQPHQPTLHTRKDKGTVKFDAAKCIVIHSMETEHYKKLNQDSVRRELSTKFGPIMVDLINRCKPNSSNPKLLVQFAKESLVDQIISKWDATLFGGSEVRKTIKPNTLIGIMKGVPLNVDVKEIKSTTHGVCDIYRMKMSDGTLLRTVKVTFTELEHLDNALSEGLLLEGHNILCRVEHPHNHLTNNG